MDKILLHGALLMANVGITDDERKDKQPLFLDLTIFYDTSRAGKSDSIDDTINYSDVYKKIKQLEQNSYCLIETIAEQVAKIALSYPVQKISVCVKKPYAIKKAEYAAVEIERCAENVSQL